MSKGAKVPARRQDAGKPIAALGKTKKPATRSTGDAPDEQAHELAEVLHAAARMSRDEFEIAAIDRALDGDAVEGMYALDLCARGLVSGALSQRLRFYLSDRLREVVGGIPPAKALRIARTGGRPKDPFPGWEDALAAFAALAEKRSIQPEDILDKMDQARRLIEGKGLSRTQAQRIRATYAPMRSMTMRELFGAMIGLHGGPRVSRSVARQLLVLLRRGP